MFNKPRSLELKFGPILGLQCKTSQLCFIFLHSTENETITNIVVQRQGQNWDFHMKPREAYIKYKM